MPFFKANDNTEIHYEIEGSGPPLLMLHGWAGTMNFFKHNVPKLAEQFTVIRMDYRGHGQSENVTHGHRVARYAMDVKNLLDYLDIDGVTALGWSMGSSVLFNYFELFGSARLKGLVIADQSPAQYTGPDWKWGQNGCYDAEMFARMATELELAPRKNAEGLPHAAMLREPTEEEVKYIADEITNCPPKVRIDIMRDHTNLDWRDILPHITLPSLVLVSRQSTIFDWQGCAYVGEQIPGAKTVFFEESGHMIYWEEPDKFNQVVADFVSSLQ
ncbi:MAG: alpha/beta fold hydrolase [Christensenellaceae bacterium]